jgi:hypothetical protein
MKKINSLNVILKHKLINQHNRQPKNGAGCRDYKVKSNTQLKKDVMVSGIC